MKKNTGSRIKLGVFVTLSLGLFIAGIYLIGQRQHMFSSTFQISGIFSNIDGLQVGSNVRFAGINVGIVQNIQLVTDTTVQVDMEIEEGTRKFIKKNATAVVSTDGFVGSKIVAIAPGSPGEAAVENGDFIGTLRPVSIDDIMVSMKGTSENALRITNDLAFILDNVSDGNGMIGKLLFDSSFAEVVEGAVVNLRSGAGGFSKNMDAASHSFLLKGYLKKKEQKKADEAAAAKAAKDPNKEADKPKRTKRNLIGKD